MKKSQWQVRPGFLVGMVVLFAIWCGAELLLPSGNFIKRAKIENTRSEEPKIALSLNEHLAKAGTNFDGNWIYYTLFDTNSQFIARTNSLGEVVDLWDTPFRIGFIAPTNFVVRSAGPNTKFGDADDIVFNSASNDFVKP